MSGRLLFKCFRDTCGIKGCIILRGGVLEVMGVPEPTKTREFEGPTTALTNLDYELFKEKYGLDAPDLRGVTRALDDQRYLLPIRGPWGGLRGVVARSMFLTPKAINYRYRVREPFISWFAPKVFRTPFAGYTILVEDWISAAKCSKAGFWCVSLNGTNISYEGAVEISKESPDEEIVLALDPGALTTAMKHYNMYIGLWGKGRVLSLEKDLKYEQEETIQDVIINGKTSTRRGSGAETSV